MSSPLKHLTIRLLLLLASPIGAGDNDFCESRMWIIQKHEPHVYNAYSAQHIYIPRQQQNIDKPSKKCLKKAK